MSAKHIRLFVLYCDTASYFFGEILSHVLMYIANRSYVQIHLMCWWIYFLLYLLVDLLVSFKHCHETILMVSCSIAVRKLPSCIECYLYWNLYDLSAVLSMVIALTPFCLCSPRFSLQSTCDKLQLYYNDRFSLNGLTCASYLIVLVCHQINDVCFIDSCAFLVSWQQRETD